MRTLVTTLAMASLLGGTACSGEDPREEVASQTTYTTGSAGVVSPVEMGDSLSAPAQTEPSSVKSQASARPVTHHAARRHRTSSSASGSVASAPTHERTIKHTKRDAAIGAAAGAAVGGLVVGHSVKGAVIGGVVGGVLGGVVGNNVDVKHKQ